MIELNVTEDAPIVLDVESSPRVRMTIDEQIINRGGAGLSEEAKQALLAVIQNVAYTTPNGQDYYDALYAALYPPTELDYITAVYTQSGTVYDTDTLDSLKADLVVTAYYDDGTSEPVTAYTLSGTLTAGTSSITVSYGGKTTSFNVTVTAAKTLSSISAVYTQSGTVYDTDSLDSLKSDLVVTATYSDSTTETVPGTDYTLSGTLEVGTSTITVSYGGKTTTFTVTVNHDTTVVLVDTSNVEEWRTATSSVVKVSKTYGGISKKYSVTPTTILYPAGIVPYADTTFANAVGIIVAYDSDGNHVNHVSMRQTSDNRWAQKASGTLTEFSQSWTIGEYSQITFDVDTRYVDDAYMYDKTTGDIFFAGKNTPYYGMRNISEASV